MYLHWKAGRACLFRMRSCSGRRWKSWNADVGPSDASDGRCDRLGVGGRGRSLKVVAAGLGDAESEAESVFGPVAALTSLMAGRDAARDRTARLMAAISQWRRRVLEPELDHYPAISPGNIRTVTGVRAGLSSIERWSGAGWFGSQRVCGSADNRLSCSGRRFAADGSQSGMSGEQIWDWTGIMRGRGLAKTTLKLVR